jgi:hypothetical protein
MLTEIEKWDKVFDRVFGINEFMDYLNEQGINLCKLGDDEFHTEMFIPITKNRDDLIAECYDIDYTKLEKERRELLDQARNPHKHKFQIPVKDTDDINTVNWKCTRCDKLLWERNAHE